MDKNRSVKPTGPSSLSARFTTVAAEHAAGTLGTSMRFLLKLTFWLGLVLVLLPSGGSQPPPNMPVNATEAFSAARAAVTDMQSFCERQVQACVVGSQTAVAIGHRAQAGAKMLYEFLNDQLGPGDTGSLKGNGPDAPVPVPVPLPPVRPSQHTLTPTDLAPSWRGPQPPRAGERPA